MNNYIGTRSNEQYLQENNKYGNKRQGFSVPHYLLICHLQCKQKPVKVTIGVLD